MATTHSLFIAIGASSGVMNYNMPTWTPAANWHKLPGDTNNLTRVPPIGKKPCLWTIAWKKLIMDSCATTCAREKEDWRYANINAVPRYYNANLTLSLERLFKISINACQVYLLHQAN